jgi:hypothetical protein
MNWWHRIASAFSSKSQAKPTIPDRSRLKVSARTASLAVVPEFDYPEDTGYRKRVQRRPIALYEMPIASGDASDNFEHLQYAFVRQLDRFTGVITAEEEEPDQQFGDAE